MSKKEDWLKDKIDISENIDDSDQSNCCCSDESYIYGRDISLGKC